MNNLKFTYYLRIYLSVFVILFTVNLYAFDPDSISNKYANMISSDNLKKNLYTIASPEFEGRETALNGQKKTADFLINQFKSFDLKPGNNGSYLQTFPVVSYYPQGVQLEINQTSYNAGVDYSYYISNFKDTSLSFNKVVFLGYGIEDSLYNDYKNVKVKNSIILILDGEPRINGKFLISGSDEPSDWTYNYRKKLYKAQEKGVAAVIIIKSSIADHVRHLMEKNRMKLDLETKADNHIYSFYVDKIFSRKFFDANNSSVDKLEKEIINSKKSIHFDIKMDLKININSAIKKLQSDNVLAIIEGSEFKDEIVVITAHYDHLGIRDQEVFVGADDDGSGTVALLELAKVFSEAKKQGYGPKRTILFLPFSGEEKGLLGSDYYSQFPVFAFKNTTVDLNIDMIGRVDNTHKNNKNYVYVIGSDKISSELHDISESVNKNTVNLQLDYTFNKESDPNRFYYRSDHYNFAKNKVPIIFYFNGIHEDYHKSSDTPDKIDYELLEKRTRLIFYTAWELANRSYRVKTDKF